MRQLIIAFADKELARNIGQIFRSHGLPVGGTAASGLQALGLAARCPEGGVIVCPAFLPDIPAQELIKLLPESFDLLVLLTSGHQGEIRQQGVFTLIYPFSKSLVVQSARQILATRQINTDNSFQSSSSSPGYKRPGNEQMLIDQAKMLLMNQRQISEKDAHRYLQKRSMESGVPMAELARRIIGSGA